MIENLIYYSELITYILIGVIFARKFENLLDLIPLTLSMNFVLMLLDYFVGYGGFGWEMTVDPCLTIACFVLFPVIFMCIGYFGLSSIFSLFNFSRKSY